MSWYRVGRELHLQAASGGKQGVDLRKQRLRSANKEFIKQWFVRGDIIKRGITRGVRR